MDNAYGHEGPEVQYYGEAAPSGHRSGRRKGRRKGLVIGLSAGGLAAAVTVVLVVLSMTVWAKPDHQDYELAARFTDTSIGFFAMVVVHTETAMLDARDGGPVEEEVAAAYDSAADFNDHLDSMAGLSAVTDDPEIAALFAEFSRAFGTNRDRVLAVADASVPYAAYYRACHGQSSEPVSQMRLGMSAADLDQVMAEYDESQVACTEALQTVAEGEHEWSREQANALLELWPPLRDATEQIGQGAVEDDQTAIQAATEVRTAASDELAAAQAEFDNSFGGVVDGARNHESSEALLAALQAKLEDS